MLISDQAKFFVNNCFEGGGSSLLLRRFVFRMAEASAKRVTGDEPQGTMGRVQQSRSLSPSRLPLRAHFHQKRDVWVRGSGGSMSPFQPLVYIRDLE